MVVDSISFGLGELMHCLPRKTAASFIDKTRNHT